MVINELTDARPTVGADRQHPRPADARPRRRWWRPGWLAALTFLVVVWNLVFVVPTYITLDPSKTTVILREDIPFHYAVVVVHVIGGLAAMLTGCLQMSARLRNRRPRLHRIMGRIYVPAVMLGAVSAVALVFIGVMKDTGDGGAEGPGTIWTALTVGSVLEAALWFGITLRAFVTARQRRFADHRRLMIYSFALTLAIMWSRPLFILAATEVIPGFTLAAFYENTGWLPWVVHLMIAQWWLNRTARRPLVLPATVTPVDR